VSTTRKNAGRKDETSFGIVDAQSVQNADCADEKGYDAGKKVSGIKRHLVVDSNGLPHAIHITTADVSDRDGAIRMISECHYNLWGIEKFLCDGGYSGERFANAIEICHGAEVEIAKRNELHKFEVIPCRWVVERSFGWLDKYRRLWKNCEQKIVNSLQMVIIAFISIILHRF
jgi:transposase